MKLYEIFLKSKKTDLETKKISCSQDAYEVAKQFFSDDINIYESCFILCLNRANITVQFAKISQGGVSGTTVDTKIVCKYAIESLASGVIFIHNHPSGDINPSSSDILVYERLEKALNVFDIDLIDSIIISDKKYYSFKDNQL